MAQRIKCCIPYIMFRRLLTPCLTGYANHGGRNGKGAGA